MNSLPQNRGERILWLFAAISTQFGEEAAHKQAERLYTVLETISSQFETTPALQQVRQAEAIDAFIEGCVQLFGLALPTE